RHVPASMKRVFAVLLAASFAAACGPTPSTSPIGTAGLSTPGPGTTGPSPTPLATLPATPVPTPTAGPTQPPPTPSPTPAGPSIATLIGQKLMVAMAGTTPSAGILDRIRRGQIGGVILFGS